MVEVFVGLVGIIVLAAVLRQYVTLARARTDVMAEARSMASSHAVSLAYSADDAEFIKDWDDGDDDMRYNGDDFPNPDGDDAASFPSNIVSRAARNDSDWGIYGDVPGNPLTGLQDPANLSAVFGLVKGEAATNVPLLQAVQDLLYDAESVDVKWTVWMTQMEGL